MSKKKGYLNPLSFGLMGGLGGFAQGQAQYDQQQNQFNNQMSLAKMREDFEQKLKSMDIQSKQNIHTYVTTGADGKPHTVTVRTSVNPDTGQVTQTPMGDVDTSDLQSAQHPQFNATNIERRASQKDRALSQGDARVDQAAANEAGRNDRFNAGEAGKTDRSNNENAGKNAASAQNFAVNKTKELDRQMNIFDGSSDDIKAQMLASAHLTGMDPNDKATRDALRSYFASNIDSNVKTSASMGVQQQINAHNSAAGGPGATPTDPAKMGLTQDKDGNWMDGNGTQVRFDKNGQPMMKGPDGKAVPYTPPQSADASQSDQSQIDPTQVDPSQQPQQVAMAPTDPSGLMAPDEDEETA